MGHMDKPTIQTIYLPDAQAEHIWTEAFLIVLEETGDIGQATEVADDSLNIFYEKFRKDGHRSI